MGSQSRAAHRSAGVLPASAGPGALRSLCLPPICVSPSPSFLFSVGTITQITQQPATISCGPDSAVLLVGIKRPPHSLLLCASTNHDAPFAPSAVTDTKITTDSVALLTLLSTLQSLYQSLFFPQPPCLAARTRSSSKALMRSTSQLVSRLPPSLSLSVSYFQRIFTDF